MNRTDAAQRYTLQIDGKATVVDIAAHALQTIVA